MLSLLSHGGCVVCVALALAGLQWMDVALQVDVARGQRHVVLPFLDHLSGLGLRPVQAQVFAVFRGGGHINDFDVRDAGLPQRQLCVSQLQLLHVVDGNSCIIGLLEHKDKRRFHL